MAQMTIAEIRQKYPQYSDLSDDDLAGRLHERFYSDMPRDEFNRRIGLGAAEPAAMGAAEPAPEATEADPGMGVGEDMLRSFGAGVRGGLESLVALPGDLVDIYKGQVRNLATRFGLDEQNAERLATALSYTLPFGGPRSEHVKGATDAVIGDALRHEPQTMAGEYARTAGEFLPGAAVPGGLVARTAAVAAPAVVSETAGQIAKDTPYEGIARGLGAVAGGSAVGVGQGVSALRAAGKADEAVNFNRALAQADEFGVPLTRGQASGDLKALSREENLRQMDGIAQRPMRQFDEAQQTAINRAVDTISDRLGRGMGDATEVVPEGVRRIAASLEAKGSALYDKAFESGLMIQKEALDHLPNFIAQRLEASGRIIDDVLTPSASRALREVREAIDLSGALQPRNPSAATELAGEAGQVAAINLKGLHQIRRRINNLKGTNPDDGATLRQVKRAFDEWMDDAVDHFLYSGDDAALDAYREATRTWKDFRSITDPRTGDTAGKVVAKMLRDDAHAQEVASWLYGANVARPNMNAPKVADRLKKLLGADSREWAAIRAGAWERLTHAARDGEIMSPTKVANNIEDFVNGSGRVLAKKLFDPEELATMKRFARTLRRTVPPKDATNPSRSGYVMGKAAQGIANAILGTIGATAGGVTGGLTGFLALPVMRGIKDIRAVRKATRVKPMPVPVVEDVNTAIPAANALAIGAANYLVPMLRQPANALDIGRPEGANALAPR